jgi:hypothetical protein
MADALELYPSSAEDSEPEYVSPQIPAISVIMIGDSYNLIQKLKIGTQRGDVHMNLFPSRKLKCIAPRHFFPASRFSGKTFRIRGKIPGRSGVKHRGTMLYNSSAICADSRAVIKHSPPCLNTEQRRASIQPQRSGEARACPARPGPALPGPARPGPAQRKASIQPRTKATASEMVVSAKFC